MKRDIIAADTMTVSVNIAVVKTDATVKTDEDVSVITDDAIIITDDVVNIAEAALIFVAVAVINTDHFVFLVIDTITPNGVAKVITCLANDVFCYVVVLRSTPSSASASGSRRSPLATA